MPTPLQKFIQSLFRLLSGNTSSDTTDESDACQEPDGQQTEDTADESETKQPSDKQAPDAGSDAPDTPDEGDTSHDHDEQGSSKSSSPHTDSDHEETHESENEQPPDEPDTIDEEDIDLTWPPEGWKSQERSEPSNTDEPSTRRVEAEHEGEGEQEIDISLYWREGDDYGLEACKQVAPYVNYAFEEAWGKKYTVDVSVVEEPAPRIVNDMDKFHTWWWNEADEDTRSKDANCLLIDDDGVNGQGGPRTAVVNGPDYLKGWDYSPDEKPLLFGEGKAHRGVNRAIHEIGHGLGLSHDGEPIEKYGERMIPIMRTSYDRGNWFIHQLHKVNRQTEPTLNEPL